MPRKARAEVEGGLYHVITRGNNRRQIFSSPEDYEKFIALIAVQNNRLPFFLYAYCLMPNHVHLLIERQRSAIGQIMHRLLTGYAQYYNRRYKRVGHLLQGRYKAVLCQSDRYLSELVRYIHLNPVRAGIVNNPEDYEYSSHRAYLGMVPTGIVQVDSVLRHFGVKKEIARQRYKEFVAAGLKHGHREEFYTSNDEQILGTDDFVDATIHRIGESRRETVGSKKNPKAKCEFQPHRLLVAVERICRISRGEFCGREKSAAAVNAKEMLILIGLQLGASRKTLCEITGISMSALSRRADSVRLKLVDDLDARHMAAEIAREYCASEVESQKSQA